MAQIEICFFIETPLEKRDYQRFGAHLLRSRGFPVSFLDLTRVINPTYLERYQPPDSMEYDGTFKAGSRDDIERFLGEHRGMIGVDTFGLRPENLFFYRMLKKYGIAYASFCANSIPLPQLTGVSATGRQDPKELMKLPGKVLRRVLKEVAGLTAARPRFVLAGGERFIRKYPSPDAHTRTIWAHTLDYDLYLDELRAAPTGEGAPYIVFLDEYFPFHPDFLVRGATTKFNAEHYYERLHQFFLKVEKETGWPVVVAAHPRSRYEEHPDYFRGRRLEKGKTLELVAGARAVIAHSSTAINFAVLFQKPIVFTTVDSLSGTFDGNLIESFARQLGKTAINLDCEIKLDLCKELVIDTESYAAYHRNYIKRPGTPEKPFWDIFADAVSAEAVASLRS